MKRKMIRYEIQPTGQYIEVPLVYQIITKRDLKMDYIVTSELLDFYSIDLQIFISFLKQELSISHEHYSICKDLWLNNQPIYRHNSLDRSFLAEVTRNDICKIFSADD